MSKEYLKQLITALEQMKTNFDIIYDLARENSKLLEAQIKSVSKHYYFDDLQSTGDKVSTSEVKVKEGED